MNAVAGVSVVSPANRLAAPALLLALAAGCVAWAWPAGLDGWRALAIVSAWAGSGLLAGSLLLMVREPRLAALFGGLDAQYRWHHRGGVLAYALLLIHPLALAGAGWQESPAVAWLALAPWAHHWPVWLGWAGLVLLMIGLAATFSAHLPYRRWRALHYLAGAGVLAGLGHVVALLAQLGPLWLLLPASVLAIAWRLLGADLGLAARPYRVRSVTHPAARMVEAVLEPCGPRMAVAPGQFVFAAFGDGAHFHGCREFHPFTVSGVGDDGTLAVGIKALGPCSTHVQALEPGVTVRLEGPFGRFLADRAESPQLWLAGGVGITPFIAALRGGPLAQPTVLIYLFRGVQDAVYLEELQTLAAADPQLTLLAEAADGSPPLADLLGRVPQLAGRAVQLCGPAPLIDAARSELAARGVPPGAIHFELFDFR